MLECSLVMEVIMDNGTVFHSEIVAEIVKTERGAYLLSDLVCALFRQAGKQRNSRCAHDFL